MDFCEECKNDKLVNDDGSIICTMCGTVQRIEYALSAEDRINLNLYDLRTKSMEAYAKIYLSDQLSSPCLTHNSIRTKHCNENNITKDIFEQENIKTYFGQNNESLHTKLDKLQKKINDILIKQPRMPLTRQASEERGG